MDGWFMKVGELAKRTGVSVRTLHYYHEIGLLVPSLSSGGGHRLYAAADVVRMQAILSLQQLGLALGEIRDCLDRPGFSAREVIVRHLERVEQELTAHERLKERLQGVVESLRLREEATAEDVLEVMEMMDEIEKYYTPEQLDALRKRREEVGEERMRRAPEEWRELIDAVRAEMEKGTDPEVEPMPTLARRWRALIEEFTGGDKGIEQSLARVYRDNPNAAAGHGFHMDPGLFAYVGKAVAALDRDGG